MTSKILGVFRDEALVEHNYGDRCTLGGISSGRSHLPIMVEIDADFYSEVSPGDRSTLAEIVRKEPLACAILLRKPCGRPYPTVVPLAKWIDGAWLMFGGNRATVWSSELSSRYPASLPVHDRDEDPASNPEIRRRHPYAVSGDKGGN